MTELITLDDALASMATGEPFDITFVKADRKRGTGGQIRQEQQAVQVGIDYAKQQRRIKLRSGNIRRIHIRLITQFNGQNVVY